MRLLTPIIRQLLTEHKAHYTSCAPLVNFLIIGLVLKHFWGHELLGTSVREHRSFEGLLANIEVNELDGQVLIDHDVLWFDIPMAYVLLVKMLNGFQNLAHNCFDRAYR